MPDKLQLAHETLHTIQKTLNAPKGQRNTFGNYNYRSTEDILEALKKTMPEGATVTLQDELRMIGDRYYIEATASYNFMGRSITSKAFAREALEKKGMDASQITGSTSSYARKYALNGLFCIDDSKDNDTNEQAIESNARAQKQSYQKKEAPKAAHPSAFTPEVIKDLAKKISGFYEHQSVMEAGELVSELTGPDKKAICKHLNEDVIGWLKELSKNPIKKD